MKMKKVIALFLAVFITTCLFCSCGSGNDSSSGAESDKLVIATSPDFPPFESLDSEGNVSGIEIDILELICEKMGKTLEIEQMDFESVLPGVQAEKFDVGVSGITITEKRQKNVLFTNPYCLAAQAIVVVEQSPITCKADLEGKAVSVQTGTTAETFCMENGYTVSSFAANSDAENALVSGKVDAWVIDDLTAAEMVKAYNSQGETQLVILDEAMTTEPYAFALAFGNEELVESMNSILDTLISDGTISQIFDKYDAPYTSPIE